MRVIFSCLLLVSVAACSNIFANESEPKKVLVNLVDCKDGKCAELSFKNNTSQAICIEKSRFSFPDDGFIMDHAFEVRDLETSKTVRFIGISPFIVKGNNAASIVWWVPSKSTITSYFPFSKHYELESSKSYLIEYTTKAYFCDTYEDKENYFLLKGKTTLNF